MLGIRPDDVVFSAAKLFFAYGLGNGMTFPLWAGATSVLLDGRPTPESTFETIVASGPHSAMPHARPTERVVVPGDLVVVDFGAIVDKALAKTPDYIFLAGTVGDTIITGANRVTIDTGTRSRIRSPSRGAASPPRWLSPTRS